ncbi:MAG TPA: hypothetical protein VMZ28_11980 [Kofleriaceae bacterium]|nr:hypothetical protein [Kofleriaceae bacterium]
MTRVGLAFALAGTLLACGEVSKKDGAGDGDGGPGDGDAGGLPGIAGRTCDEESGDRLRWRYRRVGGGVTEHVEMVDTAYDVVCTFVKAPDGELRCLPAQEPPVAFGFVQYLDGDCTDNIVDLRGDPETSLFAASPEYQMDGTCSGGDRYHFWPLGDYLGNLAGGTIYGKTEGGGCEGYAVFGDTYDYFDIEDEIPTATFVAGTVAQSDSGRVTVTQIDGDDGSRFCDERRAFHDATLDTACWPMRAEDGELRCVPESGSFETVYPDGNCKEEEQLLVVSSYEDCETHDHVTQPVTDVCGDRWRVMPYGEPIAKPTDLYQQQGPIDQCDPMNVSDGVTIRAVEEAMDPDDLALLSRACHPAGDRLEICLRTTDDGLGVVERGTIYSNEEQGYLQLWRDTEQDVMCSFRPASDGVSRCLPVHDAEAPVATVWTMYSDEECATPIQVGAIDAACGDGAPTMAVEPYSAEARIFDISGPYAGTVYWQNGGCTPTTMDVYELGFEIAPSAFFERGDVELE